MVDIVHTLCTAALRYQQFASCEIPTDFVLARQQAVRRARIQDPTDILFGDSARRIYATNYDLERRTSSRR